MKTLYFILTFAVIQVQTCAQDFYGQFQKHCQSGDTIKQKKVLEQWSTTGENNPEYYASKFNYLFSISDQTIISIDESPKSKEAFVLTDSSGIKRYLNSNSSFNSNILEKAYETIDQGIKKFPNRLDMRFGKIYTLGIIKDYETFTEELIQCIEYSSKIKNNWLWALNKKKENPKAFFLENVHAYMNQLYNTMDDDLIPNIQRIGLKTIKYYPNHVQSLSMLGITYILEKKFDLGIKYFKQALEIAPKDYIVLGNIAQTYKRKGDKKNALKYYKLASNYGDAQTKETAKKEMEKLKD